ncbi:hypothetical protein HK104_007299, partial [Borealophlyctis nickersoniae]
MSKTEVADWLDTHQLGNLRDTFIENSIDGLAMLELTEGNLATMGVPMGRIKKFLKARDEG